MTDLEWLQSGELCKSCGLCCIEMTDAPITIDDIGRLMRGLGLTFEQAVQLGVENRDAGGFRFDMSRGFCKALRVEIQTTAAIHLTYPCAIYEHRPEVCRRYECVVLFDLKEWLACVAPALGVCKTNMFRDCHSLAELKIAALQALVVLRSQFMWDYKRPDMLKDELPKCGVRTRQAFEQDLVQIENLFPPKSESR